MKYKVGDRVKIKSLDWYNNNKDEDGYIDLRLCSQSHHSLHPDMSVFCGKIVTIASISEYKHAYDIKEDNGDFYWTDEMIEGLAEEETKSNIIEEAKTYWDSIKDAWICSDGYIFKDENGNVINAKKIVLEKKKKKYPKTYEECCGIIGFCSDTLKWNNPFCINRDTHPYIKHLDNLIESFIKLKVCRDAYWKLYGEDMGLGKPWEPDYKNPDIDLYVIFNIYNRVEKAKYGYGFQHCVFTFPTEEMRDDFKKNFDPDIEICKEFL